MAIAIQSQVQFQDFGCYTLPQTQKTDEDSILYKVIMNQIYSKIKLKSAFRILTKNTKNEILRSYYLGIPKCLVEKIGKVRKKSLNFTTEIPVSENYNNANGQYSTCVWQLDKHQDFVKSLGNNMVVADGHGTDIVSDWLKSLTDNQWNNVFDQKNPINYLNDLLLRQSFSTVGSGACVTIIKTNPTYVEVFYSGDTKAQVYVNHQKVKETDKHDASNPKEKNRVKSVGAYFVKEKMMEVLQPSPNKIRLTQIDGERIMFDKDTFLQMSQCIGHSKPGVPGKSTTEDTGYFRVDFSEKDEVKVIAGSDGIWDVTHDTVNLSTFKNAEGIVRNSCYNWYNDFEFVHPKTHNCSKCRAKTNFNDEIVSIQKGLASDDISACMWHRPSNK